MQNIIAKTFGSSEINHRPNSDDGNKNKCAHDIGILNDKMQSVEIENSFLENEIHDLTTLLNTDTTSLSFKSKTTETKNTLNKKNLTVKKHLTNW